MGIERLPDGALIVCDAHRGLLRVGRALQDIEVLVDTFEGRPLRFCNNATVGRDGSVYFTDIHRIRRGSLQG